MPGKSEEGVDLAAIHQGQCWEDTDVLLQALDIQPEHTCFSIIGGGDNALAMASRGPEKVIAVDPSAAQVFLLELKIAAFKELSHTEMLILFGSRPGNVREALYRKLRETLSEEARAFWDAHTEEISRGIGGSGKLEHHLDGFRKKLLRFV